MKDFITTHFMVSLIDVMEVVILLMIHPVEYVFQTKQKKDIYVIVAHILVELDIIDGNLVITCDDMIEVTRTVLAKTAIIKFVPINVFILLAFLITISMYINYYTVDS